MPRVEQLLPPKRTRRAVTGTARRFPGVPDRSSRGSRSTFRSRRHGPFAGWAGQLTARLTSALICASTSGVTSVRANPAAHIVPSSSFAWSLKPRVA